MRCRIAVRRRDHRHIFVVNFDRQVVHSDSLDARMRNENRNLLGTTREKKRFWFVRLNRTGFWIHCRQGKS